MNESHNWWNTLSFQIYNFSYLIPKVCKRWNAISSDDLLWKGIFSRTFKLDYNEITFPPGSIRCQFHQHFMCKFLVWKCFAQLFSNYSLVREHWTGEVVADEWVPVFNWPLVLWKKYFVFIKMTYSSRYSFVACNSLYSLWSTTAT